MAAASTAGQAPKVASYAVDAALLPRLEKFVVEKVGDAGRESVHRARSSVMFSDEVRRERLPQVDAGLRDNVAKWTAKQ